MPWNELQRFYLTNGENKMNDNNTEDVDLISSYEKIGIENKFLYQELGELKKKKDLYYSWFEDGQKLIENARERIDMLEGIIKLLLKDKNNGSN